MVAQEAAEALGLSEEAADPPLADEPLPLAQETADPRAA